MLFINIILYAFFTITIIFVVKNIKKNKLIFFILGYITLGYTFLYFINCLIKN
jgi:hypothetical protein